MDKDCDTSMKDTFQEPKKRFWLRSRKRPKSDAISLSSMDISIESTISKTRKRRKISEVANDIFSSSTGLKFANVLQRLSNNHEVSFVEEETRLETKRTKHLRSNKISSTRSIVAHSWSTDVAGPNIKDSLKTVDDRKEIKRQEAIYELYCGENLLLHDLRMLKELYYEPLSSMEIFKSNELYTVFCHVSQLIDLHTGFRDRLLLSRDESGFTETVGPIILDWLPTLTEPYLERCKTQVWAKHVLKVKQSTNKHYRGFIKRKLASPRSIDLWTYLDAPRSRIVKYPILIDAILKHTPIEHEDQSYLEKSNQILKESLKRIDEAMGNAECKLAQSKLNIKSEYDSLKCIESAQQLITEGHLTDVRKIKYYCFLFDNCFVLTEPVTRINRKYNLVFPVVPKERFDLYGGKDENSTNLEIKIGNHRLTCENGHDRRHWIISLNKVLKKRKKTNLKDFQL